MKAFYPCDLHGHTNRSDGNDSPMEFIEHAVERGVRIVAITDHDMAPLDHVCINGEKEDIVAYAKSRGVRLINGIEISCETEIEDVHLVCFGCDWNNPFFDYLEELTIDSKSESYCRLVKLLTSNGMEIRWKEILENNGNPIEDNQVQKKMIFEMMAQKGYAKSWKEAKIMVKTRPELNVKRRKPNAIEIIKKIHELGGSVILAHPYLISDVIDYRGEQMDREKFIELLITAGLDGIEACYPYEKTSYNGILTSKEIYDKVVNSYRKRGLIISGGSDYHADGKKGTQNPREIGECGITLEEFENFVQLKNF